MEKDKSPGLPPSGRFSGFSSAGNASNMKPEFSHDISKMSDNPTQNLGHRRAHSEIVTLPDDINFDSDLGVVGAADEPSLSDETEEDYLSMYLDIDKLNSSSSAATSKFQVGESSAAAAGSAAAVAPVAAVGVGATGENMSIDVGSFERPRVRHQHSQSMDAGMLMSGSEEVSPADTTKKAMSATKLAELAISDPKRAKRIWANRQSAARSKERKMRYMSELERKIQTLQTEATTLAAQLSLLQRDTNGLSSENSELKLSLHTMEQQCNLQDALNDALKDEIQHMKVLTLQPPLLNGGQMMNYASYGPTQQYHPNNHAMNALQQFQQLQIHPHQHQPQFPPHQLHQLQQQQLQQQQQQAGEMRARVPVASPNQIDGSSDASSSASKD